MTVELLSVVEQAHVRLLRLWPMLLCAMLFPRLLAEALDAKKECEWPLCGFLLWPHLCLLVATVLETGTCYTRIRGVPREFVDVCNYQVHVFNGAMVVRLLCTVLLLAGHMRAACWLSAALYAGMLAHIALVWLVYRALYPRMSDGQLEQFRRCRRFLELLPLAPLNQLKGHGDM